MSDHQKTTKTLRDFNLWRRADEDMDQPDPREIGKAIDDAIEAMEELNEWKTLASWGGTPEIINDFIRGQQSRICAAQEAEEQRDKLAKELKEAQDAIEMMLKDSSCRRISAYTKEQVTAVEGGSDDH
jgi:23S rRNA A2030 N6-methylase RlmJ